MFEFRMSKNGNGEGTPPVIENSHIFQEYTYKKITPCDICSQILRGKLNCATVAEIWTFLKTLPKKSTVFNTVIGEKVSFDGFESRLKCDSFLRTHSPRTQV